MWCSIHYWFSKVSLTRWRSLQKKWWWIDCCSGVVKKSFGVDVVKNVLYDYNFRKSTNAQKNPSYIIYHTVTLVSLGVLGFFHPVFYVLLLAQAFFIGISQISSYRKSPDGKEKIEMNTLLFPFRWYSLTKGPYYVDKTGVPRIRWWTIDLRFANVIFYLCLFLFKFILPLY